MTARSDCVSLTRKLLSFDTTNPPGDERECAVFIGSLLEDAGFRTSYHEFDRDRTSVVARLARDGTRKPICLTGHIDTVPLGATAWGKDAFRGEIDGDRLYGRGASDMKAGVAAMILAAERIAKTAKARANILLIFTAGEETCCAGAYHLIQQRMVQEEVGAIVVGEPTSNYPLIGHKGAVRFRIRTTGVTAHASTPELGINAIYKAADAILKLQQFDFGIGPHSILGRPTLNVGTIVGGQNINSVPDEAVIGVDIRTVPGQNDEEIQNQLQAALGPEVEIGLINAAQGIASDSKHPWIQDVFAIMTPLLGSVPIARGATFFSDASVFTPAFGNPPTIILGPGEPSIAHKTDEYCHISKIEQTLEAYIEIIGKWCDA